MGHNHFIFRLPPSGFRLLGVFLTGCTGAGQVPVPFKVSMRLALFRLGLLQRCFGSAYISIRSTDT